MKNITFILTPNCNLKCKYCFQDHDYRKPSEDKPSKDTLKKFAEYCNNEKIESVDIFGGEPLFYKDLLKYLIFSLKEKNPSIKIGITTNGTLMDKEIFDIIKKYKISVLLSLDGNRKRHNRMRGGFDNILQWVTSFDDKSKISVAMQAGVVKRLYENIKFIWNLDFAYGVYVNVLQNYMWYNEHDVMDFEKEYEKALIGMLNGEGILNCALSTFHQLEKFEKDNECGITQLGLASDWKGNLYPCHRAVELGTDFSIGSIYSGIDSDKNKNIRSEIINAKEQSASFSKYIFSNYCPVTLYQKYNSFTGDWCDECCRMIDIKAKLVAKYYYEIAELNKKF